MRSLAAESVSYATVDTTKEAYIYKLTNGKAGSNEEYALLKSVTMDMAVGAGLHLAGRTFLGAKTMWKTPTETNHLEYKTVMPTARADFEAKYLFTKADTTGRSLTLGDGGKYTSAISGKEIEIPKMGSLISKDASEWLSNQANEMKAILENVKKDNPTFSTEELAHMAVNVRNAFVNVARQSISDVRVFAKLELDRPLWDYRYKETELAKQGFSGDALNKKMIDDALNVDQLKLETKHVQCFPAGTLVHTDQGLVPIQNVKVGDMVLSRPEWGGKHAPTEYKRVSRAFCSGENTIVQIPYIRESNPDLIHIIYMTDHHPVWVESENEWIPAIKLEDADKLSFIDSDDFAYVVGPTEVFEHQMLDGRLFGKCNSEFNAGYEIGQSILKLNDGVLETINISDLGINYTDFKYSDDYPLLDISKDNPYYGNSHMGGRKFSVPVYNLEVEEFHTYFVGTDGLWVHNDNCFYEYLPNIIKGETQPPSNIIGRDLSCTDQLPKYVTWAPTTENVNELAEKGVDGGLFITPDIYRKSEAGDFERQVWGARYDNNISNSTHMEYGMIFGHQEKLAGTNNKNNYRMYEGIKIKDNGRVELIDRKLYDTSKWTGFFRDIQIKSFINNLYRDVLGLSYNKDRVDAIVYSFANKDGQNTTLKYFNTEIKDKILADDFSKSLIKPYKDKDDKILVDSETMLREIKQAFKDKKIRFLSDEVNYQLVESQGTSTSTIISQTQIEEMLPIAKRYWVDAGASQKTLDQAQVHIVDLNENVVAITRGAQITLDATGAGWGWFMDATPLESSEFTLENGASIKATEGSAAHGKLDLLTVLIHELGHVLGLDPQIQNDVMTQLLESGERRLPSAADMAFLKNRHNDAQMINSTAMVQAPIWQTPTVLNDQFMPVYDGNRVSRNWLTQGEIKVSGQILQLKESKTQHTNLSQAFKIGAQDRLLTFTVKDEQLTDVNNGPDDAFEVALLDANTGEALFKVNDLSHSDALLNLQANGQNHLAQGIKRIINDDGSQTLYINLDQALAGKDSVTVV